MNAWTTLGLERTGDVVEIRRAYARKLKATDVDADPDAFIALREALNRALGEAFAAEQRRIDHADADAAVQTPAEGVWQQPEPVDTIEENAVAAPDEASLPFIRLDQLLFGQASAEPAELVAAVQAILDHPNMDHVDRRPAVEHWLAQALYDAIPRSDVLTPMIAGHFGWAAELDEIHQRPLIAFMAQRASDLGCIERLRNPGHRWHAAYAKLAEPAPAQLSLKDQLDLMTPVAQLLNSLRIHDPGVEYMLDERHVALWDREIVVNPQALGAQATGISWYGWLVIAWAAIWAVSLLGLLL